MVAIEVAEPPIILCRSQADVRHDLADGHSQFLNAEWTLPAGEVVIVACVYGTGGRGRCSEQAVIVH